MGYFAQFGVAGRFVVGQVKVSASMAKTTTVAGFIRARDLCIPRPPIHLDSSSIASGDTEVLVEPTTPPFIVSREIFVDEGVYGQERIGSTSTLQRRVLRAWAPSP